MIQIRIQTKRNEFVLEVEGHAGLGKKGEDILCASVSGMVQMLELGLLALAGLSEKNIEKKDGFLKLHCFFNQESDVLLKTFILSAKVLERQNPEKIKVFQIEKTVKQ
ncbi:MAG TPA: ribosomal-processing cysteine protease Prp [Spirochaetia bacterium]|nr:MAG: hypothetical protein A2Y41_04360 [Spirochaetes bacterium GWB1_36_13]HCL55488.1 ribosomal-processing cysteine protease Prp [Spirochaetia bacterium]